MGDKFNYCIAHYWPNSESVGLYAYGTNHWYGTEKSAKETLEFIKRTCTKDGTKYFICKIMPLGE